MAIKRNVWQCPTCGGLWETKNSAMLCCGPHKITELGVVIHGAYPATVYLCGCAFEGKSLPYLSEADADSCPECAKRELKYAPAPSLEDYHVGAYI